MNTGRGGPEYRLLLVEETDEGWLAECWLSDAHDSEALCATARNLSHGTVYDPPHYGVAGFRYGDVGIRPGE